MSSHIQQDQGDSSAPEPTLRHKPQGSRLNQELRQQLKEFCMWGFFCAGEKQELQFLSPKQTMRRSS